MKPVLDMACGSRMFYFDKSNPLVLFCDIRHESHVLCDGRQLEVKPDIQADFRTLPFKDQTFKLVVFDPPHLTSAGKNGWQAKKYGSLGFGWRDDIRRGVDEGLRVLEKFGTLIFKWNEQQVKVTDVLRAIGREPLMGHRTMQNSKTIWLTFLNK